MRYLSHTFQVLYVRIKVGRWPHLVCLVEFVDDNMAVTDCMSSAVYLMCDSDIHTDLDTEFKSQ